MSVLYTYICTKSTADPYIASQAANQITFNRDVSDAFIALSGGHFTVGKLAFFPVQRSVPNHLLCNGAEVPQASFPELFTYLQDSQGTPVDGANFVLPNFIGSVAAATTAAPETVNNGTVSSPGTEEDTSTPTYGAVDSGGRLRKLPV